MLKDFRKLDEYQIEAIVNDYLSGISINDLIIKYGQSLNVILSVLFDKKLNNLVNYQDMCSFNINSKKVLFVSDIHVGSSGENLSYLDMVYEYASKYGITDIVIGGDLIEGSIGGTGKPVIKVPEQAERFIKNYPSDKNINNYGIYGNHDYQAISVFPSVKKVMESRNDINIYGFKKAFFNWCGYLFGLKHEITDYKIIMPYDIEAVNFHGHAHKFMRIDKERINQSKVFLPSLSDADPNNAGENYKPGFVECSIEGDRICGKFIWIKNNKLKKCSSFGTTLEERTKIRKL